MAWNLTATASEAQEPRRQAALSVSEALAWAKGALERVTLVVEGEVSQFKDSPAYKAVYFPVADRGGVMDCMMWRNRYAASQIQLRPGLKVRLTGRFSVYPAKGRMQFEVFKLEPAGEGDLRERVARLARRLQAEGLMEPARKLPVPAFCQRVVVVTSPHGKVKDDVARTLRRRNPLVELQYCPVAVEGSTAAAQMVEALRIAQEAAPDAILLVRGGGSYEDLMPFNDEGLARAVAACRIPVVTGIGHEPDTTLCDMVADRRASTPTAAAESVAPSAAELEAGLAGQAHRLAASLHRMLDGRGRVLDVLAARPALARPRAALIEPRAQRLDLAQDRLVAALPAVVSARKRDLEMACVRLSAAPPGLVGVRRTAVDASTRRLLLAGARLGERERTSLATLAARFKAAPASTFAGPRRELVVAAGRLEALSPLAVIARGYAAVFDEEGRVVAGIDGLAPGDLLEVRLSNGIADCSVRGVRSL